MKQYTTARTNIQNLRTVPQQASSSLAKAYQVTKHSSRERACQTCMESILRSVLTNTEQCGIILGRRCDDVNDKKLGVCLLSDHSVFRIFNWGHLLQAPALLPAVANNFAAVSCNRRRLLLSACLLSASRDSYSDGQQQLLISHSEARL